ncbi:MAG: LPS assembly protein LptD [Acidobacteriota bacterium]
MLPAPRRRPLAPFVLLLLSTLVLATAAIHAQAPPSPPTVDAAADADATDASAEAAPPDDRIVFRVRIDDAQGGGQAEGRAGEFDYREGQYLVATDNVELRYRDLRLRADRLEVDIPTQQVIAEGNVVLDEGPQRLSGDLLDYDLEKRTGRVVNARATIGADYFFSGRVVEKLGDADYRVEDGTFTSCDPESPAWRIQLGSADVTLEGYARIRNARMRFGNVPVFYLPYLLWPAKTTRTSGLLIPKPGYSSRRGAHLGMAYYQTLGRSADATFYADLYSEEYFGGGVEVRYRPSENTVGQIEGYYISEPDDVDIDEFNVPFDPSREPGDPRWKLEWQHVTENLWNHFRGVIDYRDYSDLDFQRDYERDASNQTRAFVYSNAYLSGNIGQHSLNLLVDQRERVLRGDARDIRRQLPEFEYRLRPTRIGNTPIYAEVDTSLHAFRVEVGEETADWQRADIAPNISVPLSTLPWLSVKVDLGGRFTYYSDSFTSGTTELGGNTLERSLGAAGVEIVGPSFSRIFDLNGSRFSKLKHLVEPRIEYAYISDFDEQDEIPTFDEIDRFLPVNGLLFTLTQRFIAKPRPKAPEKDDAASTDADDAEAGEDAEGEAAAAEAALDEGAFEIGSFSISQGYSLDDELPGQRSRDGDLTTDEGPINLQLRINPSRAVSVKADARYNTLFNEFEQYSLSGGVGLGKYNGIGFSYLTRLNAESMNRSSEQARLSTQIGLVPGKLELTTEMSYDLRASELLQQRYFLTWKGSCYTVQLEYRASRLGAGDDQETDRDFRFSLSLKNVGTFLDLTGSAN